MSNGLHYPQPGNINQPNRCKYLNSFFLVLINLTMNAVEGAVTRLLSGVRLGGNK